jgi:hypothetical protein
VKGCIAKCIGFMKNQFVKNLNNAAVKTHGRKITQERPSWMVHSEGRAEFRRKKGLFYDWCIQERDGRIAVDDNTLHGTNDTNDEDNSLTASPIQNSSPFSSPTSQDSTSETSESDTATTDPISSSNAKPATTDLTSPDSWVHSDLNMSFSPLMVPQVRPGSKVTSVEKLIKDKAMVSLVVVPMSFVSLRYVRTKTFCSFKRKSTLYN